MIIEGSLILKEKLPNRLKFQLADSRMFRKVVYNFPEVEFTVNLTDDLSKQQIINEIQVRFSTIEDYIKELSIQLEGQRYTIYNF